MKTLNIYITEAFRLRDNTKLTNPKRVHDIKKIAKYFGVEFSDVEYLYDTYYNCKIGKKGHTDDLGPCCTDFEAFLMYAVNYAYNYKFNPYDFSWFDDDHHEYCTYGEHYEKWMNEHPEETRKFIKFAEKMKKNNDLESVFYMWEMIED